MAGIVCAIGGSEEGVRQRPAPPKSARRFAAPVSGAGLALHNFSAVVRCPRDPRKSHDTQASAMVLFFESKAVDPPATIYMGKDKVCSCAGARAGAKWADRVSQRRKCCRDTDII